MTQLLTFARKETPSELPLRSAQLIEAVVRLFQSSAEKEGVKLSAKIEHDEELGGAAVSAVRVALSNLLLNALQATPSGGEVAIAQRVQDGEMVISVQHGSGIQQTFGRNLEPFVTTKQRAWFGLAIVRNACRRRRHGRLESRPTGRSNLNCGCFGGCERVNSHEQGRGRKQCRISRAGQEPGKTGAITRHVLRSVEQCL